ncbi:MAG: DUF4183 domain-containing protein [Alicyclobacillus macrosporangiidus]|uniref:DUF4183 domain-containing protein n=1 Tax=Alicyclobacillus macrosporangiidus TaxID=392015 RepID=UPI0026EAAB42|nr:DUF4183 domain-containing protein [Alicyclobacillus macrosporangiidus]MCL6597702.1 DUF4183 domain-containing protein [Alicyclobacillus macrosporangiidus]
MSDLTYRTIDKAIAALQDARHHLKHDEPKKAASDAKTAYRYLWMVFPNIYKWHDHDRPHHYFCCCCHHPQPHPSINIASKKFFARASAEITEAGNLIVFASSFVDDSGNPVSVFPFQFEFYSLYINGMIQMNNIVSVKPDRG